MPAFLIICDFTFTRDLYLFTFPVSFISTWGNPSLQAGLVVKKLFSFGFSGKVLISPSVLKGSFTRYRIRGWQLFWLYISLCLKGWEISQYHWWKHDESYLPYSSTDANCVSNPGHSLLFCVAFHTHHFLEPAALRADNTRIPICSILTVSSVRVGWIVKGKS